MNERQVTYKKKTEYQPKHKKTDHSSKEEFKGKIDSTAEEQQPKEYVYTKKEKNGPREETKEGDKRPDTGYKGKKKYHGKN